jgi:hypothetical protein
MVSMMENNFALTMHPGNKEFGQGKYLDFLGLLTQIVSNNSTGDAFGHIFAFGKIKISLKMCMFDSGQ